MLSFFLICGNLYSQTQTKVAHLDSGLVVNEQLLIDAFQEETGDSIHYVQFYQDPITENYFLRAVSYQLNDIMNVYDWDIVKGTSNDYFTVNTNPLATKISNCKMWKCVCPECGSCPSGSPVGANCTKLEPNKNTTDGHIGTFY